MTYRQVSLHPTSRIAPNATIVGNVTIGPESLVLYNSVLRGDCNAHIIIGSQTNLQEMSCVHVSEGFDCVIGNGVTVGHGAILHGCTIEDNCLIGMGAVVMDGAHIGENSLVAAGALVTEGVTIPPNSLVLGHPARVKRALTDEEIENIRKNAREYLSVGLKLVYDGLLWTGESVPITALSIALSMPSHR